MDLRKLLKTLSILRLTDAERASMRATILARVQATAATPRIPSPYAGFFLTLTFQRSAAFLLMIAVAVSSAGGVTLAAEDAVPGDTMYAVKVNVTEPLSSIAALTPSAKAAVATSRVEARLKEAEVLAVRGSLDEATAEDLSERFTRSAEEASVHIEGLIAADLDEGTTASTELQSVLAAHGRVLDDIVAARSDETEDRIAMLRAHIAEREVETEQNRAEVTLALLTGEEGRERSAKVLEDVTEDAENAVKDLEVQSALLPAEDALAIDSRVAAIVEAIDEGKAKHELGAYQDAFSELARARTVIGIGKRLLEAKERFDEPQEAEEAPAAADEDQAIVATEAVAEPEAATMTMTLDAPAAKMAVMATTTTATTTNAPEAPAQRTWKGFMRGPHPIRIDLRP